MRKTGHIPQRTVGIAWYRPEQWQRLREVAIDIDDVEETHAEWLGTANNIIDDMEHHGIVVRKVDVDVEELVTWCIKKGLPLDAKARASFAVHKLQRLTQAKD
jgi:hypothetical protein